ncbi:MAG: riboflavin synthase [Candidatus Magasanikbacteria bacterium]|nr:riboflavin synthase [Candidatus Magasanikbacteria bacterium]
MFTGIITHTAKLFSVKQGVFVMQTDPKFVSKTKIGDSIAVNGVCLTVEKKTKDKLSFSAVPETLKRSNLGDVIIGEELNLDMSLTMQTFLSGHLVQGHVDGIGEIKEIKKQGNSREIEISVEKDTMRFLVEKGSIALNGISLTIAKLKSKSFVIAVIPHTWQNTNLKNIKLGDKINIEIDVVAKYIKKFLK